MYLSKNSIFNFKSTKLLISQTQTNKLKKFFFGNSSKLRIALTLPICVNLFLTQDSNSSGNVAVAKTHLSKIKRTGGGGNDAAASAVPQVIYFRQSVSNIGLSPSVPAFSFSHRAPVAAELNGILSMPTNLRSPNTLIGLHPKTIVINIHRGIVTRRESVSIVASAIVAPIEIVNEPNEVAKNAAIVTMAKIATVISTGIDPMPGQSIFVTAWHLNYSFCKINFRRDKREGNSRDKGSKSSANDRSNSKHERHHDRDRRPNSGERHRAHSREHKDRKRTRSRSRERSYKMTQPMSRHERDMNKAEQLKKMGIDFGAGSITATNNTNCLIPGTGNMTVSSTFNIHKFSAMPTPPPIPQIVAVNPAQAAPVSALLKPAVPTSTEKPAIDLSNFTAPILISPRYTEQMQKRKLLWSNKKALMTGAGGSSVAGGHESAPVTTNKWEMTKFSQDTDGKVASKFLRLMGMKDAPKQAAESSGGSAGQPDVLKKQSEMFSTMEHQYEVARQVTHTMRGMGLGFGSQRQF